MQGNAISTEDEYQKVAMMAKMIRASFGLRMIGALADISKIQPIRIVRSNEARLPYFR